MQDLRTKTSRKRPRPENFLAKDKKYPKKKKDQNSKNFKANNIKIDEEEIRKRIKYKTEILEEVLPKLSKSLSSIVQKLKVKARAKRDNDIESAGEFARIGAFAMSLNNSTKVVLDNLSSLHDTTQKGISPNVSLAICASGALKDHIIQLIKTLEDYEGTKKINSHILKSAVKEIEVISHDIYKGD